MSHIVEIKTQIRDPVALNSACQRIRLPPPAHETVKMFQSTITGQCVRLPEWRYPVVCDLTTGQIQYDNFNGRWGDPKELDRLMQSYAVEKTKLESRRQGHTVTEQPLSDGSIKLIVQVGETR